MSKICIQLSVYRCAAFIVLFSFFLVAKGQLIEMPNLELVTEKEGLPFNSLTDIVQDSKGFLWVGSNNGLARYDGYTFLEVPKGNPTAGLIITSLAKDATGMIWAGTYKGHIFRIHPETLKTDSFQLNEKATTSLSSKVFGDSQGNIWCFAEGIGLYKFNGAGFDFVGALDNLPQKGLAVPNYYNRLASFYEEGSSMIWLATSNGIYKLQTEKPAIEHVSSMSADPNKPAFLHQLESDGHGGLWCSTYGTGLMHFNPQTNEYKSYLFETGFSGTANIIYGISRKNNHELWISSGGLGVFNEYTKSFTFYYDREDIDTGLATYSMIQAQGGIIWMVSDKGLLKWAPEQNKFNYFKLKVTRSDNHSYYGVSDVLYDAPTKRKIVAASFADGLHIFDSLNKETILPFYVHPKAEPYLVINDLFKDRDGKIFVLTRDQLYELSKNNRLIKVTGPNTLLTSNTVPYFYRMIQSANGDYWVASSRNGLFHYSKKQNAWEQFTAETPNALANNRVFRVEEDVNHKIWVAHPLHGISIYDPATKGWSYLKHEEGDSTGLVSNVYTDMIQTTSGNMVFTTIEGISVIDVHKKTIKNYTETTGLTDHTIYSALPDSAGNLWAVNNRGMMVLNAKGELVREFSSKEGLRGIYSSFLLRKSGNQVYACTFQGFYTFDQKKTLRGTDSFVPLYITGVNNQNSDLAGFNTPSHVSISYTVNSLSIEFASLNFSGGNRNKYRYKMEGLETRWTETFSNQVNYSGIPSGKYTFRVQLADGSGTAEATIVVVVSTPFWKQVWFRILIISIIVGLSFLAYRARLQSVRQEEKLKADFNKKLAEVEMKALKAQMSPHFIFNSLNSINRYIVKSEPEKASLYLTKFSKLIRLILDNSNNKIISLEQEVTALKLYIELEALRFNDKFTYALNINKELNPMSIGVPPMIIQPFIENAIWHGLLHMETPGHLNITIDRFGHGLQCIVEDNGVGRQKAAELKSKSVNKEKSYGMKITTDRLSMLNGESKVSSVEIIDLQDSSGNPCGTKVIIKILSAELEAEF